MANTMRRLVCAIFLVPLIVTISSCATHDRVIQGFAFDMTVDNQHCVVLDYKYMSGTEVLAQKPRNQVDKSDGGWNTLIAGIMPKATSLYVKWLTLPSGEIHSQTVDLTPFLKRNIPDSTVYLMIVDSEVRIFQIGVGADEAPIATIGPSKYKHEDVHQIYPTSK